MYLFENYMDESVDFNPDQDTLATELRQAGFRKGEISKAFSWLEGLSLLRESRDVAAAGPGNPGSLRFYAALELERLDSECRGFLLFMEQNGVLNASTREMVIDRIMALDVDEITVEQLKWVILMVLFNQPGRESAYVMLEDLVFDEMQGHLH